MTAIHSSRKLLTVLAAAISLILLLTFASIPSFAEDTTAAETTIETIAVTETQTAEAATAVETEASTAEVATGDTSATTAASTEASTAEVTTAAVTEDEEAKQVAMTRGIINLVVGAVIIIAVIVLCIVFRSKIVPFTKSVKSELGKIVWCPKDQLKKKAIVVIIVILALLLIIYLLDMAFSEGIQALRTLINPMFK